MPVLVISHPDDRVATRVAAQLHRLGPPPTVVTPTRMVSDAVTHTGVDGHVMWTVDSSDLQLDSRRITGVLNRARWLEPVAYPDPDDRVYAHCERAALLAAMLEALPCPVVNRSNGATLAGPATFPLHWLLRAARLGLPVRDMTICAQGITWPGATTDAGQSATDASQSATVVVGTITVIGAATSTSGDTGGDWRAQCRWLASDLGTSLLQVVFGAERGRRPVVVDIDPFPRHLDDRAVKILATHLAGDPERHSSNRLAQGVGPGPVRPGTRIGV